MSILLLRTEMLWREPGEGLGEVGFKVFAGDDGVEEAVGEEELGALEALGELLADGLLDDAGAGEADERAGFGDVEVAEHGEGGGDAAGGGVGHQRDVGDLGVVEAGEAGGDFGELHEAGDALHHARAARGRDQDEGVAGGKGPVDSSCNCLSHYGTHAAADEGVLHGGEDDGVGAEVAEGGEDGVVEAGLLLGFGEAAGVGFEVGELEGVGGAEIAVDEGVAGLEELGDAGLGGEAEVIAAFGTDLEVALELFLEDVLAAGAALGPEALGADGLFGVVDDGVVFTLEPGHSGWCLSLL